MTRVSRNLGHKPRCRAPWIGAGAWAIFALLLAATGCGKSGAPQARKAIRTQHSPRVQEVVLDMLARHERGLQQAADRVAAGFVKVSGAQQESDMRTVLKLVRNSKKGVPELVISPMSFLAVVGTDGICIARDTDPDRMKGMDLGKQFPLVAEALQGKAGLSIGEFAGAEPGSKPSVTILMAAPSHRDGKVVGAMVLGIPLWRLQQVLSKQLQMELAGKDRIVIWVYVYRGAELHMHGTPPDLDKLVPDAATRQTGLSKSPGGFTGEVTQYSFWYGYGVRPLRVLGPDVGVVIFRMETD